MMRLPPRKYPLGALLLATAATMPVAPVMFAEDAADIEEVVVTGTRRPGRSQGDLPVAVDVLNEEAMLNTGQTEVGRILQTLAPSFNFSSSSISDGTDALRPATLRGLGPDQTLVLVNGKRRHSAALINVNTSVGRGAAGVDLNGIPSSAIKRIEVLRDGAAAQYGSDAIAGVINIILKDDDDAGKVSMSYGEYDEGDGENALISLNKGFAFGDNGFVNTTIEYRDRGDTNRAGLSARCQYLACSGPVGDEVGTDPREVTFDRQNFRIGDSDSEQLTVIVNAGVDFRGGELYGMATYSDRENESGGFYRRANATANNPTLNDGDAFAPDGFLPLIETDIDDYSFGFGYRYEFANDLSMDLSFVTGGNDFGFTINNSVNASFVRQQLLDGVTDDVNRATAPRSADAGELEITLTTFNADFVKLMDDFTVSFGFEYREDEYEIKAGELYSYADFDGPGNGDPGIQVFPGFQPSNEVDEDRDVVSLYLDVEFDVTDDLLLTGAVRYDDYSDFGDTVNLKGAMRYKVSDLVTLRGAISTGFRAPAMQQQYFNNISTQFIGGVALQVGTFRNDSELAKLVGIPELEEEESFNVSLGVAFEPTENLSITLDYYNIEIDDRIVISGKLNSGSGSTVLANELAARGISNAQFFLNAADTRTEGFDLVTTYGMNAFGGSLDITFAGNITDTSITNAFAPSSLQGVTAETVFSEQDRSIIEEWQPESRFSLSGYFQRDNWSLSVSLNRYGQYTVVDGGSQEFDAQILTDVRLNYKFENGVSFNVGGNNIFDETPDTNTVGQTRGGTLTDGSGNNIITSPGVFEFSRRSAPFGFNGAYFYGGVSYDF